MRERKSKRTFVLGLTMLLAAAGADAQIRFEQLGFKEAQTKAQKEGKIILVDVMNAGMPNDKNREAEEKVFTIDSVAEFFRNNVVSIRMDMASEAGKAFAPNLNMLMYPAYVFYDANGAQLQYTNAFAAVKDPGVLMQKARASAAVAEVKKTNTRSITFDNRAWSAVLQQAKSTGKLIFLDAQTEWCRPCRMMERDVFTLDKIADFYNGNFINVSMDMEKGDGPALRKQYQVTAYPTYLFIDGEGKVIHRDGGYQEADTFLAVGQKALQTAGIPPVATGGIQFQEGSWDQLLQRASRENKLIFLDAYTVWCGPCKQMDRDVFTDARVGAYFNAKHIPVKRDMEKGEGLMLREKYAVKAYPTFLFINGKGEVVHRMVGSSPAEQFLANSAIALQPEKQLGTLAARYEQGERSPDFVKQYLDMMDLAYQRDEANAIAEQYLESMPQEQLLQQQNWKLAKEHITNPASPAVVYLLKNRARIATDKDEQADVALEKLYSNALYLYFGKQAYQPKTFKTVLAQLKKSGLPQAGSLITQGRLLQAEYNKDWKTYAGLLKKIVTDKQPVYGQNLATSLARFSPALLKATGSTYASQVVGWIDQLLPQLENKLDQSKLYDLKGEAYQQAGDEANALLATHRSKELTEEWKKDHAGKGMMMAIPMKLQ